MSLARKLNKYKCVCVQQNLMKIKRKTEKFTNIAKALAILLLTIYRSSRQRERNTEGMREQEKNIF